MEGIESYAFEPVRQDTAEEEPDDASSESDEMGNAGDTEKVGNVSWQRFLRTADDEYFPA